VTFALTGSSTLRIGGIYQANALIGSYLVSAGFFTSHFSSQPPAALLLRTNGSGTVNDAVTSALAAVSERAGPDQGSVRAGPGRQPSTSCSGWSTPCSPWRCSSRSSGS
jgi:hypothetical protein